MLLTARSAKPIKNAKNPWSLPRTLLQRFLYKLPTAPVTPLWSSTLLCWTHTFFIHCQCYDASPNLSLKFCLLIFFVFVFPGLSFNQCQLCYDLTLREQWWMKLVAQTSQHSTGNGQKLARQHRCHVNASDFYSHLTHMDADSTLSQRGRCFFFCSCPVSCTSYNCSFVNIGCYYQSQTCVVFTLLHCQIFPILFICAAPTVTLPSLFIPKQSPYVHSGQRLALFSTRLNDQ